VEREKLARDLEEKGELAEALVQWKVLSTIDPDSEYYKNRAVDLGQTIDKKSKALISEGTVHLHSGAREAAKSFFLKALALNPRNREALDYLRKLSM
jgi:tetratricopeptide (TPR) repeat protein